MTAALERWHGTAGGYCNHRCRCVPCTSAFATYQRRMKEQRLARLVEIGGRAFHPFAPHGTTNAYRNYGCRCHDCTDANTAANRRRRTEETR